MVKLYTSRFSNKELETGNYTVVGIVRSMPRFRVKYQINGNIFQIAPPGYLWNENDMDRFREPYFKHLEKTGFDVLNEKIQSYVNLGKDVVFCCYEDVRLPNEWCHRLLFAEWYEKKSKIKIEELPDPSEVKYPRGKKIEAPKIEEPTQPKYEQLSLFGMNTI